MKKPSPEGMSIYSRPLAGVPIQNRLNASSASKETSSTRLTPQASASCSRSTDNRSAPDTQRRRQGPNPHYNNDMVSSPNPQPTGSSSSSVVFTRGSNDNAGPDPFLQGTGAGFMEGPLPSEVRSIIRSTCAAETAEEAEREARRLLSTTRRVKVYKEEMQAAVEEMTDAKTEMDRQGLISAALTQEIADIHSRIEALMRERSLCEEQLSQSTQIGTYRQKKFDEAQQRVTILRNTIDNINKESHVGYLMLQQMVPNLNILNYA